MDDEENRGHVGKTMEENEAYDIPGNTPHNIKRVCYPQNLCCRAVFPIVDPPPRKTLLYRSLSSSKGSPSHICFRFYKKY